MEGLRHNQKTGRGPSRRRVAARSKLEEHRAAISEVLRAIASSPHDLQPIFDAILGNATRLCRANLGTLRLYEEEGFRLVSQILRPSIRFEGFSPPLLVEQSSTFVAQLIAHRSPAHIPDLARDPDIQRDPRLVDLVKSSGIRTFLGVPMLTEEEVIGAIIMGRERMQPFTEKEIELIMDFAAQAGIALETTRRERQLRDLQVELAHASRVATMGQLTASIAHELKQPVAATITNAQTALRFLSSQPEDLNEVRQIFNDILNDGNRAAEVIDRIRDLVKKTPPGKIASTSTRRSAKYSS